MATLERVAILNTDPLHAFQVWCGRWQQSLWCFLWTCVGNSVKGVCSGRVQFVLWTRGLECEIFFGKHHFGLYFSSWAVEVRVLCSKQLVKAASLKQQSSKSVCWGQMWVSLSPGNWFWSQLYSSLLFTQKALLDTLWRIFLLFSNSFWGFKSPKIWMLTTSTKITHSHSESDKIR